MTNNDNNYLNKMKNIGTSYIGIGTVLGLLLGAFIEKIALGLLIGIVIGVALDTRKQK